ncbi:group II intron reverse transcriptase/maturase [Marinimicrobium sp. C6131]|uniref:group II intron reverse transcriptase/maturase n=1 Tax=Marinimicrobium sp. C6131 TaxID=3022676 RepID=UPI00223DE0CE|nr:group II intron reverse transcriptase/maturase [Marinimicrobium sp. C6131]UZJ42848.1 group II intron reverse transcriptase/maturase [Marinimicrobium sp. C6131]
MRRYYSLYGHLLSKQRLYEAFRHVKRNKGAAGIDGQSLSAFEANLEVELSCLLLELKEKRYRARPVRRVVIAKEDGGERLLGIPTVRDRVVQQALRGIIEPIFEPDFHPSSYGYRPGRRAHHAIGKAELFVRRYRREWVVDMDLSKCFDTLNHDLIIRRFRRRITDGSVLSLLRQFLESGVMVGHHLEETTLGSPQGGVISPLIANVYLDAFDQFMKARGHRIVRYADDILILCGSRAGAENALRVAQGYLEGELKLRVNATKTHIAHSDEGVKFLGVVIHTKYTRIQDKKVVKLKQTLKALTKRNRGIGLMQIIRELNPVLRGFAGYFRVANCARVLKQVMRWLRRRLRCIQLTQWKKPSRLHRRLKQLGYRPPFKSIKMRSWRNAASPLAHHAIPNAYLHDELRLVDPTKVRTGITVPELGVS